MSTTWASPRSISPRSSQKVEALEEAQSTNADDTVVAERFADLLDEVIRTVSALRAAVAGFSATGDYLDKTHIKSEFLPRLSGVMTSSRLSATSPARSCCCSSSA